MPFSRRDFLLSASALTFGTVALSEFSARPLISELRKEIDTQKIPKNNPIPLPPFLREEVGFLAGSKELEYFSETIQDIDGTMNIKQTLGKSRLDGHTLRLQEHITYGDIPTLLESIKKKNVFNVSAEKIADFSKKYREKSSILAQYAKQTHNTEERAMLEKSSLHYFLVANLFEGKKIDEKTLDEFKAIYTSQGTRPMESNNKKEIDAILSSFWWENLMNFIPFQLQQKEKREFLEQFETNPEDSFHRYLGQLQTFIAKNYSERTDLFPLVRTMLMTTYKVAETLPDFKDPVSRKILFETIYQKTRTFFSEKNEAQSMTKQAKIQSIQTMIDKDIQKEIQHDFESSLYYIMMDDFVLKNELQNTVTESFRNLQPKLLINGYLSSIEGAMPQNKKNRFYALKKILINTDKTDKKILDEICSLFPKNIGEDLQKFISYTESVEFLSIKEQLGKWDFPKAKKSISALGWEQKKYMLFAIMSTSWYYINSISRGSSIMEWKYKAEKFELSNLKKKDAQYNCMSISALNNYVIEELFGLTGLGMNFTKYDGTTQSHQTNGIDMGDGSILVVDATNNRYFFIKNDWLDPNFTYDIDRFSNTYMTAAYFNIHGKYVRRFFDNPFYATYTEMTGKKYFEYMLKLQQKGKNNTYSVENRKKMHDAMQ